MKRNRIIIAAAMAASCVVLPLGAQNTGAMGNPQQSNQPTQPTPAQPENNQASYNRANLLEARELLGARVMDPQNRTAGMVKDMLINLHDGRIAEVLVSTSSEAANYGGPTGVGGPVSTFGNGNATGNGSTFTSLNTSPDEETVTALPPACFYVEGSGKSIHLKNITREDLRKEQTFPLLKWKDAATSGKINETYQHYALPAANFGDLERAAVVLGTSVENEQNQKLGSLNNLVVNLPMGRVDEVILASGGFLGMDRELTALAPQSFRYDAEHDKWILNMTPDSIKSAPHFKAGEWRNNLIGWNETAPGAAGIAAADSQQR